MCLDHELITTPGAGPGSQFAPHSGEKGGGPGVVGKAACLESRRSRV